METKKLIEKWNDVLNEGNKIKSRKVLKSTAVMLENEYKYLTEAGNYTQTGLTRSAGYSGSGDFFQIAVPMVRRTFPELIAHEIVGVQPLTGPVGLAFALRFRAGGPSTYTGVGPDSATPGAANELGYNKIDTSYSGTYLTSAGEQLGSNEFNNTGQYIGLAGDDVGLGIGVGNIINEVNMTVEKAQVEAKTRKLRSRWSLEVAQDLKAMHGLDLEEEMMDILAYEITAEIDREIVNKVNSVAEVSTWDMSSTTQVDGRWESEKYRNLYNVVVRRANKIAIDTRRGAGNFVLASPYVCAAFEGLSSFVIHPTDGEINTLVAGISKMGSLDGRITVFRDTFAITQTYQSVSYPDYLTVGYKGPSEYDAGVIYLPYIQLMVSKTIFEQSFQPTVGLMSRYAIYEHIFGSNLYYKKVLVKGIPS